MDKVAETAAWLRAERARLDWSTSELARRIQELSALMGDPLSITQQTISYFENGRTKSVPRWMRYVRILVDFESMSLADRDDTLARLRNTGEPTYITVPSGSAFDRDAIDLSKMKHEAREWVLLLGSLDRADRDAVLELARALARRQRSHNVEQDEIPALQSPGLEFRGAE